MIKKVDQRILLTEVIETLEKQLCKTPLFHSFRLCLVFYYLFYGRMINEYDGSINCVDQFEAIGRSFSQISGWCFSRFHPTDPVLACGSEDSSSVFLLKGANGSIPFSDWEIEQEFNGQNQSEIWGLEWNVSETL